MTPNFLRALARLAPQVTELPYYILRTADGATPIAIASVRALLDILQMAHAATLAAIASFRSFVSCLLLRYEKLKNSSAHYHSVSETHTSSACA